MARLRESLMNPFLYKVLANAGYAISDRDANVKAAAMEKGISYPGLNTTATITGDYHRQLSFHLEASKAFGIPFELWVKGLLNQLDDQEERELDRILRKQRILERTSKVS